MSTVEQVLKSAGRERRAIGRTHINRGALLYFHGGAGVLPCCVRDVTNSGAGVRLEQLNVLPVEFDLSFDNFRTVRECRLVWRDADFVGVAFGA
ncbi:PilZ domain-containing protein [Bradyrhizobium sp. JYMT SZCCT0428]|uniref:PilZ domain-containing protein n=1 Tax=Bradyrhizobium sp. JYMT SZCCT0428 TaxID=2807673 RepID=UPI001BA85053|nr:PilZ domain-containing protein [Bradyrhizobium sp. JYMT SZCCT0428]MBR1153066.1 PilZ domain-containing protein [Bradyrhizobium sp. JYMT SZCCT0428]